jgi:hypothetical protein
MRKSFIVILTAFISLNFIFVNSYKAKADEGMWLPFLVKRLNYADMQKEGLKLSAEEIYSVNHSSLKDAIVQFGNGCTGEIVSKEGLIFTNHHCGYGKIQEHSSIEHDYLTDGFWAYNKKEELPNPGFFVKFLIRVEDVTARVLESVTADMSEEKRAKAISEVSRDLSEQASQEGKYDVVVKPFFNGNEYYMFVMQTYRDVRLVGAPPSSIGKYGGDTDNWMWPRHTGDFSIFRVYTAPDGSPADYSKDNIPMTPKHHLPVSIAGVDNGDFAMIMGYPGSTDRYMTSYGIEHNLKLVYPTRIKIRRAKLDIYGEDMKADPKVRIQYATKYAHVANYWKNFIGMSKGLKKLKVADKKRNTEEKLTQWINADPKRKEMYGEALSDIENAYKIVDNYTVSHYYFIEAIYLGPEAIKQALGYRSLLKELKAENSDQDKINKMVEALRKPMDIFYKDFNISTDKKVWAKMMQMYAADVEISQQPEYLINANKKYKGNFDKMADKVFESTIFASKEKLAVFLNNPSAKTLENDPAFIAMTSFFGKYNELKAEASSANEKLERGNRLFIDALRKMETDKKFYPDANFTMRLSYGTVKDYYPEDAVHFKYYTTLKGVMEKEDPNNPEFVVAKKLKELYLAKDYGQYGEGNTMRVCFLTNNDITGGNSGSPVINGSGQLIGLAFDGNWEAMSGDIAFEPELQRTIVVDARYVLFIIDKYAGATNLIDEMDIVKNTD